MEVWDIINITADAHPIHLHLVQFQILERIPFESTIAYFALLRDVVPRRRDYLPGYGPPLNYNEPNAAGAVGGNPDPLAFAIANSSRGPRRGPAAHERGWKDTVDHVPRRGDPDRGALRTHRRRGRRRRHRSASRSTRTTATATSGTATSSTTRTTR